MNRDFKGVWIPKEIWENNDLTWMEKLLFTEIDSLDAEQGCYASNKYFGKFFNLSAGRVSQIVNSLIKKHYVSAEYIKNGKEIEKRILRVLNRGSKYSKQSIKNTRGVYLENDKENNTMINNTMNNTMNKNNGYSVKAKEIIKYLNQITNDRKRYRPVESNLKYIIARLKEGYSVEDCKKVLDTKWHNWQYTEFEKYFRPVTLFAPSKFAGYLCEKKKDRDDIADDGTYLDPKKYRIIK